MDSKSEKAITSTYTLSTCQVHSAHMQKTAGTVMYIQQRYVHVHVACTRVSPSRMSTILARSYIPSLCTSVLHKR